MRSIFPVAGSALLVAVQSLALAATPVAVSGSSATLSPDNTKIQFVGTHSPPKQPDPRTGGFAKFKGKAEVDAATKSLKSVSVEIDTASLFTEIGEKLTNHLKSPDFFEVKAYPKATFESTKVTAGEKGKAIITGKLSLHGVTKEISFPATVEVGEKGLTLTSEFSIDRTQFGMTYGLVEGGVEPKVSMKVVVGEKTTPK